MKISKVNHTKAAVSNAKSQVVGMLYVDPSKDNVDMDERIKKLGHNARDLYRFFNAIQPGNMPKEPTDKKNEGKMKSYATKLKNYYRREQAYKKISGKNGVNAKLMDIFFTEKDGKGRVVKTNDEILADLSRSEGPIFQESEKLSLTELITLYMRKGLAAEFEGAVAVFKNAGNKNISAEDKELISAFCNVVRKDYNKQGTKEYIAEIERSIHNQNMPIQATTGVFAMPIPSDDGKKNVKTKKTDAKKGASEFLRLFSTLDAEERMNVLRKLRRLVDLYYGVPADYDFKTDKTIALPKDVDATDFDIWAKHNAGKNKLGTFVNIPEEIKEVTDAKVPLDSVDKAVGQSKIKKSIQKRNQNCFLGARTVIEEDTQGLFFEDMNINMFWIDHFSDVVMRLLEHRITDATHKLQIAYLSEKTWADALNFISTKMISLGKAIYHFGMEDLSKTDDTLTFGLPAKNILDGLTSFDYEMIKAQETLQRETTVHVSFAANNFFRSVLRSTSITNEKSDPFLWSETEVMDEVRAQGPDVVLKNVLQYFGGISKWDTAMFASAYDVSPEASFINDIREALYVIRNESFHFQTMIDKTGDWNTELIGKMFKKEMSECAQVERQRFYSNNLPMFYTSSDLERAMNRLYAKYVDRAAQVPSFNKVIVRKNFKAYMSEHFANCAPKDAEDVDKWLNAVYFLFKQIYYNDFLKSGKAKSLVIEAAETLSIRESQKKNNDQSAISSFQTRIKELGSLPLEKICQMLISECNAQNTGHMKVRTSQSSTLDKPIFQHYELLLKKCMGRALAKFIIETPEYKFVKNQKKNEMPAIEEFLPNWKSAMFEDFANKVLSDANLQKWYIMGRFLSLTSLNQMVGSMRSYLQYGEDIERRAKANNCKLHVESQNTAGVIRDIIHVLDLCILSGAGRSKKFDDYFEDKDQYAEFIAKYVEYPASGLARSQDLLSFCGTGEKFEVYMDKGGNPILNANVISAKLYGPADIIANVYKRVTEDDLRHYYSNAGELAKYRAKGSCESEDEQEKLNSFMRIKNHVELRDVATYAEIINELLGQLINWSAIRERDLLYYQLGFHYSVLQNEEAVKPEEYCTFVTADGTTLCNAILYQVAAMYIFGKGVYTMEESGYMAQAHKKSTGKKIGVFCKYSKKLFEKQSVPSSYLYEAGLEAFEKINEHDDITDLRNYIDHFHYYTCPAELCEDTGVSHFSILDLYSEVFDRFFVHDMKYRKNVVNILENVLAKRYFVLIDPSISSGSKKVGKEQKARAQIDIDYIKAESFTYVDSKEETFNCAAKDENFLRTVADILYYPAKTPESCKFVKTNTQSASKKDATRGNHASFGKNKSITGALERSKKAIEGKNAKVPKSMKAKPQNQKNQKSNRTGIVKDLSNIMSIFNK